MQMEHFSCCWVSLKERAAAFSLRKTPIETEALHYTYRKKALVEQVREHGFAIVEAVLLPFHVKLLVQRIVTL